MTKHILTIAFMAAAFLTIPSTSEAAMRMELIEVDESQPQVTVKENSAIITGAAGKTLYIYNIAGVCIQTIKIDSQEKRIELNLSKGCYILKVDKTARKVSIK